MRRLLVISYEFKVHSKKIFYHEPRTKSEQSECTHNQRGFAHLLLIIILLAGVGIGVYLVQQTQIFKPKAATTNVDPFSGPYGSTPLTEIDKYPRPAAGGIQTMSYLIFNGNTLSSPPPEKLIYTDFLTKQVDYVWFDQSSEVDCDANSENCTYNRFFTTIAKLHQINPKIKIGVHAGAVGQAAQYHLNWPYLVEADFLHKTTGERYKNKDDPRVTWLNLPSVATRDRIANAWADMFSKNPALTAINLDAYGTYEGNFPNGCKEANCNTEGFWDPAITDLSLRIKNAAPNKETKDITYNGLGIPSKPNGGEMNSRWVDYHDGVLVEWAHQILTDWTYYQKYLFTISNITNKGKKVWLWIQPDVWRAVGDPYLTNKNIAIDLNLQRFYLATYLLIQKNPLTFFGYHPGGLYDGNNGLYFYKDWNQQFGDPVSNWTIAPTDIYIREYTNGWAVTNPYDTGQGSADGSRVFNFPGGGSFREWDPITGALVTNSVTVPKQTGKFYFKEQTLKATYSTTPPTNWVVNQAKSFDVTVTNTGTQTWTAGGANVVYLAAYIKPTDDWVGAAPNQVLVQIPHDVAPGQSVTLTVNMGGVPNAGNNVLWIRMLKNGIAFFEPPLKTDITVSNNPVPPPPNPPPPPPPVNRNYDVNGDGRVNYQDALAVFRDLGKMKCGLKTDVNKDCRVNTKDIQLVIQNYTR